MLEGLGYDTEIDTPATIAVIGGGPCGVEAALYGRFLGYSVELFDSRKVGDSLLCWGDRPMPGTWAQLTSSLGLAALEAHDHPLPNPENTPTYREYVEQYLLPTARNDLLYSSVSINTPVHAISRLGCSDHEQVSLERRAEQEFRLLLSSSERGEFSQIVDIVLDCTGSESTQRGMASGGGQPIGWNDTKSKLFSGRIRIRERKRDQFAGKRVLLWGNNSAAIANALELIELTKSSNTQLYWIVPKQLDSELSIVNPSLENSPLSQDELLLAEQEYQNADSQSVMALAAWGIEAIHQRDTELVVTLQSTETDTLDLAVDHVINCSDWTHAANYQHNLRRQAISDETALLDRSEEPLCRSVLTSEPHFYLLGQRASVLASAKESPVHPYELMLQQIRQAYALIGGRADLDLYKTVRPQDA